MVKSSGRSIGGGGGSSSNGREAEVVVNRRVAEGTDSPGNETITETERKSNGNVTE